MKIVVTSNFDREDFNEFETTIVGLTKEFCEVEARKLNQIAGPESEHYYMVVADDYICKKFEP